jgi:hypothetical protein
MIYGIQWTDSSGQSFQYGRFTNADGSPATQVEFPIFGGVVTSVEMQLSFMASTVGYLQLSWDNGGEIQTVTAGAPNPVEPDGVPAPPVLRSASQNGVGVLIGFTGTVQSNSNFLTSLGLIFAAPDGTLPRPPSTP